MSRRRRDAGVEEQMLELLRQLRGGQLAIEALLTQVAWRFALTQPHPPTELAAILRPIEEQVAQMRKDPGNDPGAVEAYAETIQGVASALEQGLQKEALRRAEPQGPGNA